MRLPGQRLRSTDLPAAQQPAAAELEAIGLLDSSSLWRALAPAWTLDTLLGRINARRAGASLPNVTRAQLADVVAFIAERDAERHRTPPSRVASQALVLIVIPLLLILAWRQASVPGTRRAQMTVAVDAGLPPFHVIAPEDVRPLETPLDSLAFVEASDVVGRVTLRAHKAKEVLRADQLGPASVVPDLNTRVILTVPVRATDSVLSGALPAAVTLLFTERPAAAGGAAVARYDGVYLLAVAHEAQTGTASTGTREVMAGATATIAVTPAMLDEIHPRLGTSDITLAWPPPRR